QPPETLGGERLLVYQPADRPCAVLRTQTRRGHIAIAKAGMLDSRIVHKAPFLFERARIGRFADDTNATPFSPPTPPRRVNYITLEGINRDNEAAADRVV